MIVRPNESQRPLDVHLAGYVRAGGGWLATKIYFLQGGRPVQVAQYTE